MLRIFVWAVSSLLAVGVHAGVVILGTRVIYPSDARDVNLKLTNKGATPSLVQAWVDAGDATVPPEELDVPFNVTPALVRIEPERNQVLRIAHSGEMLPADRETVYWLNVLEIPPKPSDDVAEGSYFQFAVRSRLKVFYRPLGLAGAADEASSQLSWQMRRDGGGINVTVSNPTPFHVSFAEVRLARDSLPVSPGVNGMVMPFGSLTLRLEQAADSSAINPDGVLFKTVNDYGAFVEGRAAFAGLDGGLK